MEKVEDWVAEVTVVLSGTAKKPMGTALESQSRRNNIRIFGVAEEEGGNS